MTSRRSNNVKRTEWSMKCREELSAHIYKRLGIAIEASQVRLKTNIDDPYMWERMEEKEHLFSKNLSDLSTGQLKDLCAGIDKSFVAIHKAPVQSLHQTQDEEASLLKLSKPELSFVAKIDDLNQDNIRLAREIGKWERGAAIESKKRQTAEWEATQLKATVRQLHIDNEKLEKHISEWKSVAEASESNVVKYRKEISKIFAALEEVKSDLPNTGIE